MSDRVLESVARWSADGLGVAIATVADTRRSAPLPVGSKLAIAADGRIAGAVSGGCVEAAVVALAEGILRGDPARLVRYGIAGDEAWEIGLPCGGEIAVYVERYEPAGLQADFNRAARTGGRAVLVTAMRGPAPGARLLLSADGTHRGSLGDPELDAAALEHAAAALWSQTSESVQLPRHDAELLVEAAAPPPRLIVFGAVDFAACLCTAARLAGWRAYVIDPRARFATAERFPDAEAVIAAWPARALAQLEPIDRGTAIAVLTHDPKLDDAALALALSSQAGYIGAMGSRQLQRRRRARLQEAGFGEAEIARIAAPIGLDLGALSAGETALSIMAEIVALGHGRSGGRLKHAGGRIHDATTAQATTPAISSARSASEPNR